MIFTATFLRMFKFGCVGVMGFAVDSGVLLFCIKIIGLDPYSARIISYIVAATATWFGNRMLTFADRPKTGRRRQWLLFLAANGPGMLVNNSVYALAISHIPYVYDNPVWAVAAGSVAGMLLNYVAATRLVFPRQ